MVSVGLLLRGPFVWFIDSHLLCALASPWSCVCPELLSVCTSITLVLSVSRSSLLMGTPFRLDQGLPQIALFYLNYLFKDLFPNIVLTSAYKSKDDSGYHRVKKYFSFNRQEHIFKAKHGWWHISIISLLRKQAEGWRFEGYPVLHNITSSFKTAF